MTKKSLAMSYQSTGWSPRHAAATPTGRLLGSAGRCLGVNLATLALTALLVPLNKFWAAQILLVLLLFIVPGLILLRALRVPGEVVSSFPGYIPCASIIILFATGLCVDIVGPLVGVAEPLRVVPLLVGFEVICLVLLAVSLNAPSNVSIQWRSFSRPIGLAWPLILCIFAAAGALRLNSGHGNDVALIAVAGLVALLVAVAAFASRLDETMLEAVLYAAALAASWSYSLRGDGIYGFDIATEYQRLQQTILTGVWHPAHPNDAYGAMLSVTVMPTVLHALSGIAGLLVFKVVYPMVYAIFPVGIFDLARRLLSRRWAFIAAAFTIGQYAFTEIPSIARQEIGLVLFIALIAAMLETRMHRWWQWTLVALLGLAMVVSHYSTTYVAITVIGLTLPLQWAVSWFRGIPRITGAMAVTFVTVLVGAVIWYVPVTHSDSHLRQVAQTVEVQGLDLLPNRPPGGSFLSAYLQGNTKTTIQASRYEQLIHSYYEFNRPFIKPLSAAHSPSYALRDSVVPVPRVTSRIAYDGASISLLLVEQLANVLAGLGALLMVLRRKASVITRQMGLLALVTTLLLTVLRFSGTLALAYGEERAQLQGLVLLAIALCWTMEGLASRGKGWNRGVVTAAAACLAVVFANTTYLVGALLGGGTSVNLANSGVAFEYFYTTEPEFASAQWLGSNARPGQLVYADEYGQLPLIAVTGIQRGLILDLTPLTLNQHAWVYASRTNIMNGRAFALYNDSLATYFFPARFLDSNYDLVYTDGTSEVFHR
jgi:uncharacterized membrane protein